MIDVDGRRPVSVIMNCFNGEEYLRAAIDSVLAQTYSNWELIFWDNQSTDRSAEIFESYDDPRLKYFYAPVHASRLYDARNHAIAKSSGDFLAFLDVDDWWLPDKLERQIALFADPEVGLVCGNAWIVNQRKQKRWKSETKPVPTGWVLDDMLRRYYVLLVTLVVRRTAFEALDHPCDPRYHIIGDLDLVVRLCVHWKLDCVQDPVAFYRLHDNNETLKNRNRPIVEMDAWLEEIGAIEEIRKSPGLADFANYVRYLRGMQHVAEGDAAASRRALAELPWGRHKLRLWIARTLPSAAVRRLRN